MIASIRPAFVLAALTGLLATACSMADSTLLEPTKDDTVACRTSGGAYSLSKSYISFEVHKSFSGPTPSDDLHRLYPYLLKLPAPVVTGTEAEKKAALERAATDPTAEPYLSNRSGVAVVVKPDPETTYCVDYRRSITSDDTYQVTLKNHLLEKIATVADDKSKEILQNLVQALFVGLSGDSDFPGFRSGRPSLGGELVFTGTVDPFDHTEVNRINHAINRFGFCMFLENEPIDPAHDNVDAYCEAPLKWRPRADWVPKLHHVGHYHGHSSPSRTSTGPIETAGQEIAPPKYSRGIFYRPRLPYTYYLYVKENLMLRGVRGAWKMRGATTVMLENAAPVFTVGVDRTFFAKRSTTLVFDQGVLKDVTIEKGSELVNFVTIPLQVARSIAALPSAIIKVNVDQNNNRTQLIEAQDKLIKQLDALQKAKTDLGKLTPAAAEGASRSASNQQFSRGLASSSGIGQCTEQCQGSTGKSAANCQKWCRCQIETCRVGSQESCAQACALD
jgi:hypothetical protein